jgi:hypothetical protein
VTRWAGWRRPGRRRPEQALESTPDRENLAERNRVPGWLQPGLRRAGLPGLAAAWCTLLIAALVLGGLVLLVTNRVSADYPTLVDETRHTTAQVESVPELRRRDPGPGGP